MTLPWRPLVALLLVTGCAPAAAPDEVGVVAIPPDCGLRSALRRIIPRPGSGTTQVESGDAIRACALPAAADIEIACETEEAVPIPGSRNPDNPEAPDYAFPAFTVTGAECAFLDGNHSRAACSFNLARPDAPRSRVRTELVHRFRDLSNSIAHDYYSAFWEVDAVCRPALS